MELFLIRHLKTKFNQAGLLQGTQDIPILEPSAEVWSQIEKNKQRLTQLMPFDAILVSEYQRTHMTASCYGYDQEMKVDKLLNELNFGVYEGRPKSEMIAEQGDLWLNKPQQVVLGEAVSQLGRRVTEFINRYKNKQRVLVFGHGSWSRAIYSLCEYGNIDKMNHVTIANNDLLQLEVK